MFNLLIKTYQQVSVLITSRPGFCFNLMKHFDSIFMNIGYDEKNRQLFIEKFCTEIASTDYEETAFTEFKDRLKADNILNELCRNPLNLSILCMLVAETNIYVPHTRTALYMEMENFIIQKASMTLGIDLEDLREKCRALEGIAYHGITRGVQHVSDCYSKSYIYCLRF
jgi:hypothetical protein